LASWNLDITPNILCLVDCFESDNLNTKADRSKKMGKMILSNGS